jgi:hypothetical protein
MKREYINGNKQNGIKYDFNEINKLFKSLNIPKDVYNPAHLPFDSCKWFVTLSERSRGKTTNLLLYGMCIYQLYHTGICYIRSSETMIVPKQSKDMFSNIISWGYVEKLTDGIYNTITYKSRRWYLAHVDENGNIDNQDVDAFCIMLSIDNNEKYKSVLETKNDFIIFDEFIERNYYPHEFISFCDLVKTILRDRQSGMLCLASNTIDRLSPFFKELEISERVETMEQGDQEIITTPQGTKIYVEILGKKPPKASKKQSLVNRMYYGFSNPRLASITGNATWNIDNYPHTPKDFRILERGHYISYNDKYISLELCQSEDIIFVNCHLATQIYDDSIIYSLSEPKTARDRYKTGFTKMDKYIFDKYKKNLFRYADNSVGSLVEKYLQECKF